MNHKKIIFLGFLFLASSVQHKQVFAAVVEEKKEPVLLKLEKIKDTDNIHFADKEVQQQHPDFEIPEGSRIMRVSLKKEGGITEALYLVADPTVTLEGLKTNKELIQEDDELIQAPYIMDITSYYTKNGIRNNPFKRIATDAEYSEAGKKQLTQMIANKQADEEIFETHVRGEMHFYHCFYLVKQGIDFNAEMAYLDFCNGNENDNFCKTKIKNVTADYDAQGNKIEQKKEDEKAKKPNKDEIAVDPIIEKEKKKEVKEKTKTIEKKEKKEQEEEQEEEEETIGTNTFLTNLLSHKGKISAATGAFAIGTTLNTAYKKALVEKKITEECTFGQFTSEALKQALLNPFKAEHTAVTASVWATIAALAGCATYDYATEKSID